MRKKEIGRLGLFVLCWMLICMLFSSAVCSERAGEALQGSPDPDAALLTMNRVSGLIEETLSFQIRNVGADSLQAWADGSLADTATGTGGWYLIALRQNGNAFDDSRCREKWREAVSREIRSITVRLRMSLTGLALGTETSFAEETVTALAEEKTLMPLVFGLHLLNNGISSASVTREKLVRRLLDLQLEDGGWAVIGKVCDVDCTAMVLQALAPLYNSDEDVRASVERGTAALHEMQLDNGGFTGMGMESAESCAQVLLALSCLGIDCERDEWFLRNGNSVLDALLRFRLEDGGFSHAAGKGYNETATVQAFYALVGYLRMLRGEGSYYLFEKQAGRMESSGGESSPEPAGTSAEERFPRGWIYAGIGLLGLLAGILSWVRGRRNWRTYAFIAGVTVLLAFGASRIHIQSPDSYYAGTARTGAEIRTVISIRCDPVAGQNEYAPADGVILAETEIRIPEGGSAFDQLAEATRIHRIQMEYDGTTAGAYVRGISYLYEYDFGNLSGWMYRVNGEFADVGASQYTLTEGDRVEWIYSTNIGKDLE